MEAKKWDIFISHASEDKEAVARPLAELLRRSSIKVWLDEHQLKLGDSLSGKIDEGLAESHFGVVILSPAFFAKHWPKKELAGLRAREEDGPKVILPVWHNVDKSTVAKFSPTLADAMAVNTAKGINNVASAILDVVIERLGSHEGTGPGSKRLFQELRRIRKLIEELSSPQPDDRQRAADLLGDIGPRAESAIPALCKSLADDDLSVQGFAISALVKMGPDAVTILIDALEVKEDSTVKTNAIDVLGRLGPAAASALGARLKDQHAEVRRSAASALAKVGRGAAALPDLIDALKDSEEKVRECVAEVLGGLGPAAAAAVPALIETLKDQDVKVRRSTASALAKIGQGAVAAVPALVEALKDDDEGVREYVVEAMGGLGPAAAAAVPALGAAMKDQGWGREHLPTEATGQSSPADVSALIDTLNSNDT